MQTTPSITDTRHQILLKIVQVLYNAASSPAAALAPALTDTRWQLIRKWNQLKNGS